MSFGVTCFFFQRKTHKFCNKLNRIVKIWGSIIRKTDAVHTNYVEYQLRLGRQRAGMVHSISGCTQGVQVKLWDPLRTCAIPERLRGVVTTRRYTNPRLPYLTCFYEMIAVRPDGRERLYNDIHQALQGTRASDNLWSRRML